MVIGILYENSKKEDFLNLEGRTPAGSAHKHVSPQKGEPLILYSHRILESRQPHTGNGQLRINKYDRPWCVVHAHVS
jgi:hypothetical protein